MPKTKTIPQPTLLSNIDDVLKYMVWQERAEEIDGGLISSLGEESNFQDMTLILNKLRDDGYIKSTSRHVDTLLEDSVESFEIPIHSITFNGKLFYEQGGYGELTKQQTRLSTLEQQQARAGTRIVWLTFVIAFSTLIQALYYFFLWRRGF